MAYIFIIKGRTNWKYILIIVILALIVVGESLLLLKQEVSVPPPQPIPSKQTQDETANWKTYKNEEYGFEIKYPKDWETKKVYGGPEIFEVHQFFDENKYSCGISILIREEKTFEGEEPSGYYGASGYYYQDEIIYFEPGTKVFTNKTNVTISDIAAIKFFNPEFSEQGVYFLKKRKNEKELYFHIFLEPLLVGTHDPIIVKEHKCGGFFNQMLSTFRFLPPQ